MLIKSDFGEDSNDSVVETGRQDFLWKERTAISSDIDDSSLGSDQYQTLLEKFQENTMENSKIQKDVKHKKKKKFNDDSHQDKLERNEDVCNEIDIADECKPMKKIKKEKKHENSADESFEEFAERKLNYLVKKEKVSDIDSSSEHKTVKSKRSKTKSQGSDHDSSFGINSDHYESSKDVKKKKSKSKSGSKKTIDFQEEESYLNSKVKMEYNHNKSNKKEEDLSDESDIGKTNGTIVEDILELGETVVQSATTKNKLRKNSIQVHDNNVSTKPERRKTIAERIVYEEDVRLNNHRAKWSFKLSQYIENNNLIDISTNISEDFRISEDDDVWLVHCPRDVNHHLIKTIDLSEDTCKMKVDGKRYEGTLEGQGQQIAVSKKGKVQGVSVQGIMKMNRRVPRVRLSSVVEGSSDQVHPIPLPTTTVRHPLFGVHYENYLKLPDHVVNKLNEKPVHDKPRKRKHSSLDTSQEITVKKKKKKHDKNKNQVDNIEWDSAQQIEQSLFG